MMLQILTGDCMDVLPTLPAQSVQCCVTSPPYWGLRDYGTAEWEGGEAACEHKEKNCRNDPDRDTRHTDGRNPLTQSDCALPAFKQFRSICGKCGARRIDSQLGLESTPEDYLAKMVAVFRELWRVLRDDGTLWVNMGDSYVSNPGNTTNRSSFDWKRGKENQNLNSYRGNGLKPKDLCMMPARLAMALQADGWYLRSDIIWHKPNPMPESCTDRPTKSHEYIFLLAKQERYFYDADAIREPANCPEGAGNIRRQSIDNQRPGENANLVNGLHKVGPRENRNKRTVWRVATQPYSAAHFATFPEDLIKPCIMAGSRVGDTVLDPFGGSGTTGKVAIELGRKAILIELNPAYVELAKKRTDVTPAML